MASGKVVGGVFLAADELLWVEKLAVCSGPHFIDDSGFQIDENGARNVLPRTSFTEKGVEGIVSSAYGLVTRHLAIRLENKKRKNGFSK